MFPAWDESGLSSVIPDGGWNIWTKFELPGTFSRSKSNSTGLSGEKSKLKFLNQG